MNKLDIAYHLFARIADAQHIGTCEEVLDLFEEVYDRVDWATLTPAEQKERYAQWGIDLTPKQGELTLDVAAFIGSDQPRDMSRHVDGDGYALKPTQKWSSDDMVEQARPPLISAGVSALITDESITSDTGRDYNKANRVEAKTRRADGNWRFEPAADFCQGHTVARAMPSTIVHQI